jgi:hypothetical protein
MLLVPDGAPSKRAPHCGILEELEAPTPVGHRQFSEFRNGIWKFCCMMRGSLDNFSALETLVHDIRFQTQGPDWPKSTVPDGHQHSRGRRQAGRHAGQAERWELTGAGDRSVMVRAHFRAAHRRLPHPSNRGMAGNAGHAELPGPRCRAAGDGFSPPRTCWWLTRWARSMGFLGAKVRKATWPCLEKP